MQGKYQRRKKAFGPTPAKSVPIKSKSGKIIKVKARPMEPWGERYKELSSAIKNVNDFVMQSIPTLSILSELDEPPTQEEPSKAIDALRQGKSPGNDGIPGEVIKTGNYVPLKPLHNMLCKCWKE
ncbi:hypothetical protein ElyMa_001909500 [Elysia marginata]|uniref:Reverse transcriptase domain-containing protein n=1 Tax=Elysia marginata TaxID=1093978 RepID=A0AAV4ESX4_9GAST|nr:hypothetical protein ElyMa_001909500 [Elysia marginata]